MMTIEELDRNISDLQKEIDRLSSLKEELYNKNLESIRELGNNLVGKCFKIKCKDGVIKYIFASELVSVGADWIDDTLEASFKGMCITIKEDDSNYISIIKDENINVYECYLKAAEIVDANNVLNLIKNKIEITLKKVL